MTVIERCKIALSQAVLTLTVLAVSQWSFAAEKFDSKELFEKYRSAMMQGDAGTLKRMIAPDALVKVSLVQKNEPNIVISLSRTEYLQQIRALWRFSSEQRYAIALLNVQEVGTDQWSLALTQKDEYKLFGESIGQNSDIVLQCELQDGAVVISAIRTVTRQW